MFPAQEDDMAFLSWLGRRSTDKPGGGLVTTGDLNENFVAREQRRDPSYDPDTPDFRTKRNSATAAKNPLESPPYHGDRSDAPPQAVDSAPPEQATQSQEDAQLNALMGFVLVPAGLLLAIFFLVKLYL